MNQIYINDGNIIGARWDELVAESILYNISDKLGWTGAREEVYNTIMEAI